MAVFGTLGLLSVCHLLYGREWDRIPSRHLGAPRTIVDVDWNGYPHEINQKTVVGVPGSPDRIRFGSPFVRHRVGQLVPSVLELNPSQNEILPRNNLFYDQIEFDVEANARGYRISCDFTIAPRDALLRRDSLSFFFDGRLTTKLVFMPNGFVRFYDYPFIEADLFEYPVDSWIKMDVLLDFEKWKVVGFINDRRFEFPLEPRESDLRDFRVNFSDPTDQYGRAAIDNVKIIGFGSQP